MQSTVILTENSASILTENSARNGFGLPGKKKMPAVVGGIARQRGRFAGTGCVIETAPASAGQMRCRWLNPKDSPVNGTSASIARRMSGSRAGFLRLPRLPRPESGSLDGPPRPPEVAFFLCRRGVSPSPAASRLFRDPASGSGQRLWMSIVGSSSGDDWKTSRSS